MTTTVFQTRLLGGRDLAVTYDNGAGTIAVLGQSLTLSTLSSSLQAQFAAAVAGLAQPGLALPAGKAAFGGDNIGQAIGAIADASPAWRSSVLAVLAGAGPVAVNEGFNR